MEKFASLDRTIAFGNAFPVEGNRKSPVGAVSNRAYQVCVQKCLPVQGNRNRTRPGALALRAPRQRTETPPRWKANKNTNGENVFRTVRFVPKHLPI